MSKHKPPTGTAEAFSKAIEHEQKQPPAQKLYEHEHAIDLHNGQRAWEGDHRVVIVSRDLPMNAEILVDGKAIGSSKRIEIDVDCNQPTAIVKVTQLVVSCDDELQQRKQYVEMLTANLLDITLEEARVVDVILNRARQEAIQNAQAVQLFSITEGDENDEPNMGERILLSDLLRDAKRYRALRARIASQPEGVEMWYQSPEQLDHHADDQAQQQAAQRREQQS